jgi:hypothetical protein
LEDNYFFEGDIKTLSQQRNKFDQALKSPTKKTVTNPPPSQPPVNQNPPQPEPPKPKPNKNQDELVSVKMLNNLLEKRNAYLRTIFREGEDIYEIQSRYIEYEHQIRKTMGNMEDLFVYPIPPNREAENDNAIQKIYMELEVWETIQKFNQNKGLNDFKNLEATPIEDIRSEMKTIVERMISGDTKHLVDPQETVKRGQSIHGEDNIPKSFLKDKSFIRKRDEIKSLQAKHRVIPKTNYNEEPEVVPEINVRPSPEEEIRENKDDSEMQNIGEGDQGEQVSHINVEEDSEIEYHIDQMNGNTVMLTLGY